MALRKCEECGNEVSTEAKACPKCGAKQKRPVGLLGWMLAILFLGAIVENGISNNDKADAQAASEAAKSPAQRAAEEKQKVADNLRFVRAQIAAKVVKSALRNPDSIVWENVYTNTDASAICLEYRAQNGFGGMSREYVAFVDGRPTQSRAIWNKCCAGPSGFFTLTKEVNLALAAAQ